LNRPAKEIRPCGNIWSGPHDTGGFGERCHVESRGERLIQRTIGERDGEAVQTPVLVDGLQFAPRESDERKVIRWFKRRQHPPAARTGELREPEFFQYGGFREGRSAVAGNRCAIEGKRIGTQQLGETKGQRTTGEYLAVRISGDHAMSRIGRQEAQSRFVQRTIVTPETGGAALSHDGKLIVPFAVAQRAETAESLLKEISEGVRVVWETCDLHVFEVRPGSDSVGLVILRKE
jgi:hypothetical protein